MATTIFGSLEPTSPDQSDGTPGITMGTRIRVNVDGHITGVRWRCPNTLPSGTVQWFLVRYNTVTDAAGASLGSGNFTGLVAGVYNTVSFAPIAVFAGEEFVPEVWTSGRYVATPDYFTIDRPSVDLSSLTAPADVPVGPPVRRNGRFKIGAAPAYANDGFNETAYHVDFVFEPLAGAPREGALSIVLSKPSPSFSVSAISAAALGVTLPKPILAMNGGGVAGANLGLVLSAPAIALGGGSLPENLREYVWRRLSQDATMNALGINAASLYGTNAPDSPAKDQQVWGILAWGQDEAPPGRDTDSRRRFLVFWAYCRDNDYLKIEPILYRAKALLYPLKAVNYAPGGWITEVGDGSLGEDLYDPVYEASTKGLNLTIVASGI